MLKHKCVSNVLGYRTIPILDILKSRRINYLYYILSSNQNEMLPRVFRAQIRNPTKGDWPELVKKDLEDFKINLSLE